MKTLVNLAAPPEVSRHSELARPDLRGVSESGNRSHRRAVKHRSVPLQERREFVERLARYRNLVLSRQCGKNYATCIRCDRGFPTIAAALQDERWCEAHGRPVLGKYEERCKVKRVRGKRKKEVEL